MASPLPSSAALPKHAEARTKSWSTPSPSKRHCHNHIGHNYKGHNHLGHNYIGSPSRCPALPCPRTTAGNDQHYTTRHTCLHTCVRRPPACPHARVPAKTGSHLRTHVHTHGSTQTCARAHVHLHKCARLDRQISKHTCTDAGPHRHADMCTQTHVLCVCTRCIRTHACTRTNAHEREREREHVPGPGKRGRRRRRVPLPSPTTALQSARPRQLL